MKKYRKLIIALLIFVAFCISICFIPIDASKFIPTVEKQAEQEFGIKVHIEKLIFRFGPSLKIKTPVMHIMYEDGQKFGQLNNVKFYVPWSTIFKENLYAKKIYADKFILKIDDNDKYLNDLINKFSEIKYEMYPNLTLRNYDISYKTNNKEYKLAGNSIETNKIQQYLSVKLNIDGDFYIDNKRYIKYNLSILPQIEQDENFRPDFDFVNLLEKIEKLDFHSDIIADVKLQKDSNNKIQTTGLINIDNISVLDPENKNPKSFIYLTFFDGTKTGILSNIYASGDKKIYAEGVINNSQKPDFDLKVKTDNVKITDIYQKLKIIVDCSKYKFIDNIDGNLAADFNIKGNLKKIRSNGYLNISDGKIQANGINIKNITSNIDFSNNIISIKNAKGFVNDAPVELSGSINKELDLHLLMNEVQLKDILPQNYGIQNGVISINADLSGTMDNIIHKENLSVEKFKANKNDNLISFDYLKLNTNKENTAYISNLIINPKYTEFIKFPLIKLIVDKDKILMPACNAFMPNSKLQTKGNITGYNSNNPLFDINISGSVNSKDLFKKSAISAMFPVKININGDKTAQNVESQIQLSDVSPIDEPALANLNAKFENNNLKIDDLSLLPFSGSFSDNLKANIKGAKKIVLNGNIENIKSPVLKNIRIFIPQQINLNLKDTTAQIKCDLFVNGDYKKPEIIGQLSASNIANQNYKLTANNLTVDFNKNTAFINAPVIKVADSSAGISAYLSTDFNKEIKIKNSNIKSKYINLDNLLQFSSLPITQEKNINVTDGKIFSERVSATIFDSPIYLSVLNSDFNLNNNILKLNNLTSDIYNGKLAGNIELNIINNNFKSSLQARGVSASPVFDIINIKKDRISGILDFDTNLDGNIYSKQSLNGNIKFIIHNGHLGTLGKLEHLLYAQNVIADSMMRTSLNVVLKAITLKDTGLFKYLRSEITLKDGIANIHSLQSCGPLMALYVTGSYNLINDYAKLTVLGRLSDDITGMLGSFGDFSLNKLMIMLTGEENKSQNIKVADIEKLPQLTGRNTKEFRTIINGTLEKPSSVIQFNWISYTQKSLKQKEVNGTNEKLPDFLESLPY